MANQPYFALTRAFLRRGLLLALVWSGFAGAVDIDAEVAALQTRWAEVNYQLKGDAQLQAFAALQARAEQARDAAPRAAPLLIWSGIIKSSYAGAKGGLGALALAKSAKQDLENAIDIDHSALQGSAQTSLGTLYFNVPGWPLGFGDDKKARALLEEALTLNPDGIDPNYFYGLFLLDAHDYKSALAALEKARRAPPRPGRELADQGRRADIEAALVKVKQKLE